MESRMNHKKNSRGSAKLMSPQEKKFVELVATQEMSHKEAYLEAFGQDAKVEHARMYAHNILEKKSVRAYLEELQQIARQKFIEMVPAALVRLQEIAESANSEKVKLEANLEILDRAGLKPPDKVELTGLGVFGAAQTSDIKDVMKSNMTTEPAKA